MQIANSNNQSSVEEDAVVASCLLVEPLADSVSSSRLYAVIIVVQKLSALASDCGPYRECNEAIPARLYIHII